MFAKEKMSVVSGTYNGNTEEWCFTVGVDVTYPSWVFWKDSHSYDMTMYTKYGYVVSKPEGRELSVFFMGSVGKLFREWRLCEKRKASQNIPLNEILGMVIPKEYRLSDYPPSWREGIPRIVKKEYLHQFELYGPEVAAEQAAEQLLLSFHKLNKDLRAALSLVRKKSS